MKRAVFRTWVCSGLACVAGLFLGCSSSRSSLPVYDPGQTGAPIAVQKGRIVAVRDVIIKAPTARAGATASGATLGIGAVTSILTGSTAAAASAVGRVVGGQVGASMDDKMGEEITIEVEGGQRVMIVQEQSSPPLAVDEEVELQTIGGLSTVPGIPGSRTIGGRVRVVRPMPFEGQTRVASVDPRVPVAR